MKKLMADAASATAEASRKRELDRSTSSAHDLPTMSKVHCSMFLVQEAVEALDISAGLKKELLALLRARWDYGFLPLQGAGYVLDPEFWDCDPDPETKAAFRTMVDKTYADPPELEEDADADAVAARDRECAELKSKRAAAERQLATYKQRLGVFARDITIENARLMSAADWWTEYGDEVPELQLVAARVCGAVSGAGAAERGHKEMAFLLTKSRNRMLWPKVEKMMYVRINQNMMRKRQRIGYSVDVAHASDLLPDAEDDEQPAVPSAWREAEEEAEEAFAAEADHAQRGARYACCCRQGPLPQARGCG
jgi:chorismate mutase